MTASETKTKTVETLKLTRKSLKMVNALFTCPNLGKNVTIAFSDLEWDHDSADCDLCGSHGHLEVSFKCQCGKNHSLRISEW